MRELYDEVVTDPSWIENATDVMEPIGWASESFALATGNAYWFNVQATDPIVTNGRNYPSSNECPLPVHQLTEGYYHHTRRIIHQRIIFTALRLAFYLNNIFTDFPTSNN